jgi:tryptophan synthase alpha chain
MKSVDSPKYQSCLGVGRSSDVISLVRKGWASLFRNPIVQYGIEPFVAKAASAGIDGVIVPDLPPEESGALAGALTSRDLVLIFLLAPTSDQQRIHLVAKRSRGFIYLVSLVGVTGARAHVADDLITFVSRVRAATNKPLAVGFGISRSRPWPTG